MFESGSRQASPHSERWAHELRPSQNQARQKPPSVHRSQCSSRRGVAPRYASDTALRLVRAPRSLPGVDVYAGAVHQQHAIARGASSRPGLLEVEGSAAERRGPIFNLLRTAPFSLGALVVVGVDRDQRLHHRRARTRARAARSARRPPWRSCSSGAATGTSRGCRSRTGFRWATSSSGSSGSSLSRSTRSRPSTSDRAGHCPGRSERRATARCSSPSAGPRAS
jgi:hypothetical protein